MVSVALHVLLAFCFLRWPVEQKLKRPQPVWLELGASPLVPAAASAASGSDKAHNSKSAQRSLASVRLSSASARKTVDSTSAAPRAASRSAPGRVAAVGVRGAGQPTTKPSTGSWERSAEDFEAELRAAIEARRAAISGRDGPKDKLPRSSRARGKQGSGASRGWSPVARAEQPVWLTDDESPYSDYLQRIYRKIQPLWRFPQKLDREFEQGDLFVRFTLSALGEVDTVIVEKSSGFPEFDGNAVAAIRRAAPFGPVPPGFARPLVIIAPFEFSNPMVR